MASCCILLIASNAAFADSTVLPTGGEVVAGKATIGVIPNGLSVTQTSDRSVIDWSNFSVGKDRTVDFVMPSSNSAVLNRVTGSETSSIAGSVTGNGRVYLVNPNGIAITSSGAVKVGGGFVASTLDIGNGDFMDGKGTFSGTSSGRVTNEGTISVGKNGFVGLISNNGVKNDGLISVPAGKVALGTGSAVTLDPSGNGFMQILAPSTLADSDGVSVDGRIHAAGGRVELKASTAERAIRDIVKVSGEVEVSSVRKVGGTVILDGGKSGVSVTGKIRASSRKAKGGRIAMGGEKITLAGATIEARGADGGKITIGGGWQGAAVPGVTTANAVHIDRATVIDASGAKGRGGEVVVWSNRDTFFEGTITATANRGKGGDAEVSSHGAYYYGGTTNLLSTHGKAGNLLLDPYNLTISSSGTSNAAGFSATGTGANINSSSLSAALGSASVTVSTGSSGAEAGDITLNATLSWSADTTLTLNAARSIYLNGAIYQGGSAGGVSLIAGGAGGVNSTAILNTAGQLTITNTNAAANGILSGNLTGGGTLVYNGPTAQYVSGIATPTLTILGDGVASKPITVMSGVLSLKPDAATGYGRSGIGVLDIRSGAVVQVGAALQHLFTYYGSGSLLIKGAGTFQKIGAGGFASGGGGSMINFAMDTGGLVDIRGGGLNNNNFMDWSSNKGALNVAAGFTQDDNWNPMSFSGVTGTGTVQIRSSGFTIGADNWSGTITAALQGAGKLVKAGSGAITVTNAQWVTGGYVINGGTLKLGSASAMSNRAMTFANGGTVDMNGYSLTPTSVDGLGYFTNSAATGVTLTINNSTAMSMGGILAGTGAISFVKQGTGTLSLIGAGTHTGSTTISAGTIDLSGSWNAGAGSIATSIAAGASLTGTGVITAGNFTTTGAGSVSLTGANMIDNAAATGTVGAFRLANAKSIGLGAITSTGAVSIDTTGAGSDLTVKAGGGISSSATGTAVALGAAGGIYVNANVTATGAGGQASLAATGTAGISGSGTLSTVSGLTLSQANAAANTNYSGTIGGTGSVTKSGAGRLAFTGTVSYSGNTTVNAGTLAIASSLYSSTITINSGAVLEAGSAANMILNGTASTLTGSGTLRKVGTGWVGMGASGNSLNINMSAGGLIDVQAGRLVASTGYGGNWTNNRAGINIAAGAIMDTAEATVVADALTGSGTFRLSNPLILGMANGSGTFAGILNWYAAGGALTKNGTGTQQLTGLNNYTGATTVNGGTLMGGSATAFGNNSAVTVANGAILDVAGVNVTIGSLAGGGIVINNGAAASLTTGGLGSTTFSGGIYFDAGPLTIVKTGSSNFTLAGDNDFDGLIIDGGTVTVGSWTALTATTAVTINNAGILDLAGYSITIGDLASASSTAIVRNSSTTTAALDTGALNLSGTFAGRIQNGTGTVNFLKSGSGTLTLTNANTYSGTTAINGGTLKVGNASALSSMARVTLANGGMLDMNGNSLTLASLAGSGNVTNTAVGAVTLTTGSDNTSTTLSGGITAGSGTINLVKTGTGTFDLVGANTYTGTTTISGGTLKLSGTLNVGAGSVTTSVAAGASLTGTGVITAGSFTTSGAGSVSLTGANMIDNVAATGTVGAFRLANAKSVALGSIASTGVVSINAAGSTSDLTLKSGALISSAATGDAIMLGAGRNFVNNSGSTALSAGSGRWLVYAAGPTGNTFNNLNSNATAVWNTNWGTSPVATGNRYVFALSPTLTVTLLSTTKTYGNNATSTVASLYTINGVQSGVANAFLGDTQAAVLSGTASITSTGSAAAASIGAYAVTAAQGSLVVSGGYQLAYASTGTITVNKANLMITGTTQAVTYSGGVQTNTFSTSGLRNSDTVTNVSGRATGTGAGTYAESLFGATGTGLSNYNITYVNGSMTITPANLTITGATQTRTYNGGAQVNTFTPSGLLGTDTVTSVSGLATGTGFGSYNDSLSGATGTGLSNYNISYVNGSLAIGKASLMITGTTQTKTYTGSAHTNTFTTAGLLGSDTVTGVSGLATGTNATVYTDSLSNAVGTGLDNYNISYVNGNMTIGKANLTITGTTQTKTYTGGAQTNSFTSAGLLGSDTVTGVSGLATGNGVGTYSDTLSGATGSGLGNYNVSYVNGSMVIGKANLTITGTTQTKTYTGGAQTNSFSAAGLLGSDSVTGVSGLATGTGVGSYSDTLSGATGTGLGNYNISYVNGSMAIDKANLTIMGTTQAKTYSGGAQTNSFSTAGLLGSDSVTGVSGLATGTGVGSYSDALSGATGNGLGNYNISYVNGSMAINKANLTITGTTQTKTYTGGPQTNSFTSAGLLGSDSVTGVSGLATGTGVGSYSDTLSGATGSGLGNYNISYVNGSMAIGKANLTITGTTQIKTYTGGAQTNSFTYAGLLGSDTVTGVSGLATGTGVGSYSDTLSGATGTGLGNYNISYVNGSMAIGKANLTITGTTQTKTYSGGAQTNSFSAAGLLGSDSVTGVSGLATGTGVGSYSDTLSGAIGTGLGNYNISYVNGSMAIGKANLTITGNTTSRTYDGTARVNGFTTAGLLGSDSVTGAIGLATGTNAGSYTDNLSGATGSGLGNYNISYVNGGLTINRASLTITGNQTNRTYDATAKTNSYAVSTLYGTDSVTGVSGLATGTNAGGYMDNLSGATGTGLGNYDISYVNGGLTINKAALTITGNQTSRTYDATAKTNSYAVSTLYGTDSVTGVSGLATGTNAGSYTDNLSGATGSGLGNYDISYVNGGLTINRASLTISGTTQSKTYSGGTQTNGFTTAGLLGTDSVTGVRGLASGTDAGSYMDALSDAAGSGLGNYDITYVNGGLTIGRASLTITGATQTRGYSGGTQTNGFATSGLLGADRVAAVSGLATGADVGTYADNLANATGSGLANYDITYVNGGLTIGKAHLTITGGRTTKSYTGLEQVNAFSVAGLLGADSVTAVSGRSSGTNTGRYDDNLSNATGVGLGNYDITYVNGGLTISKASLVVTAADAVKTADGSAYLGGNGLIYSGFVNGENEKTLIGTIAYGGTAQGATKTGTYTLTASGLSAANYDVRYVAGKLTIENPLVTGVLHMPSLIEIDQIYEMEEIDEVDEIDRDPLCVSDRASCRNAGPGQKSRRSVKLPDFDVRSETNPGVALARDAGFGDWVLRLN
jgi:filamentous hemagglutinin family protein